MTIDPLRALPFLSPVHSAEDTAPHRAFASLDGPVSREFSPTLNVTYMVAEPGALVFVRQRDIEGTGCEQLHALATGNLRAYAAKQRIRCERHGAAVVARLDGRHDASLLLLDELWDLPSPIAKPAGELLAIVVARETLVLTGSEDAGGVAQLRATLGHAGDRALSSELFVRRNGAWQPFVG